MTLLVEEDVEVEHHQQQGVGVLRVAVAKGKSIRELQTTPNVISRVISTRETVQCHLLTNSTAALVGRWAMERDARSLAR